MEHVECEYLVLMSKPWGEMHWARMADPALGGGHGRQRPIEHGDRDRLGVFAHRHALEALLRPGSQPVHAHQPGGTRFSLTRSPCS